MRFKFSKTFLTYCVLMVNKLYQTYFNFFSFFTVFENFYVKSRFRKFFWNTSNNILLCEFLYSLNVTLNILYHPHPQGRHTRRGLIIFFIGVLPFFTRKFYIALLFQTRVMIRKKNIITVSTKDYSHLHTDRLQNE